MDISVVVVALNHQETIMQCIESVLSQSEFPDELGLMLGDSMDSTDEFAGFYREEFDFVREQHVNPSSRGRSTLRLNALDHVSCDRVWFIPGSVFVYRDSLKKLKAREYSDGDLLIMGSEVHRDYAENYKLLPPEKIEWDHLHYTHALFPDSVLWSTKGLMEIRDEVKDLQLGPFSTHGWLYALGVDNTSLQSCQEPMLERWGWIEGDYCWTSTVVESANELADYQSKLDMESWNPCSLAWTKRDSSGGKTRVTVHLNPAESESLEGAWKEPRIFFPE